jgi:hypothetical protein
LYPAGRVARHARAGRRRLPAAPAALPFPALRLIFRRLPPELFVLLGLFGKTLFRRAGDS